MIIQCEKCQTKFKLDDSRVTDKGVKVRCTKCKHVFRVQKDAPDAKDNEACLIPSCAAEPETSSLTPEDNQFAADSAQNVPFDSEAFDNTSFRSEPADLCSPESSSFDSTAISFDTDDDNVAEAENTLSATVKPDPKGGEIDFSGFDFSDNESTDSFSDSAIKSVPAVQQKEAPQGLDFSDDDMFGAVVQATPETSNDTISFDFEGGSFAESMDMGGQDSISKSGTLFSLDSSGNTPFNLGEIDFGDELTSVAVQQVNPDDLKPSQEILFAPLAKTQVLAEDDELARSFLEEEPDGKQQELPPLSIASRRKRNPLFSGVIVLVALIVFSVICYLGYSSFSANMETASPETGKINIRIVKTAYLVNDTAGELLVISGEAINEYPKPRAALQVKVTIFDATEQAVATKTAYAGNPLTVEQLKKLPLDKIETAMANQFGDSLANMEVAPGKSVPFVVVLANLPKGAKDFAVQSAGSTVATVKQQ